MSLALPICSRVARCPLPFVVRLDCVYFTIVLLRLGNREVQLVSEREHVTLWMRQQAQGKPQTLNRRMNCRYGVGLLTIQRIMSVLVRWLRLLAIQPVQLI